MNYNQAIEYLEEINKLGIVLGLETMEELMKRLGNPQDSLEVIHIAGTNGKGSTLAFISSILKESGKRVGRYISPTVYSYTEKFEINEKMMGKRTAAKYIGELRHVCEEMVRDGFSHPTTFEIETAIAFCYFKDKKCDFVVLETGLGGETDATNVIHKEKTCVFTSISKDHCSILGENLSDIARIKAGILHKNCIAISALQDKEVADALNERARTCETTLDFVDYKSIKIKKQSLEKQIFSYKNIKNASIRLLGTYQIENAVLAIETIFVLRSRFPFLTDIVIKKGLEKTAWEGRFSIISKTPMFIVDGAHNPDGAKKLAESIQLYFTNKKIVYIMGILKDKEYEKIVSLTAPLAIHIITITPPNNKRAMGALALAEVVRMVNPVVTVADSIEEAVEMAYLIADMDTIIIAFGSLSYLGNLTEIVKNKEKIRSDTHGRSK